MTGCPRRSVSKLALTEKIPMKVRSQARRGSQQPARSLSQDAAVQSQSPTPQAWVHRSWPGRPGHGHRSAQRLHQECLGLPVPVTGLPSEARYGVTVNCEQGTIWFTPGNYATPT